MANATTTLSTSNKESALVAQLQDERQREVAFGTLVSTYQERLYYHVRRMLGNHDDADDVLQNTFIKVWKALDRFRGDSKLHTWLYRIATNEALTALEKRKRRSFQDLETLEDNAAYSKRQESETIGSEIEAKLDQAILGLPDRQKAVFNLRYFDEMPYEEMSNVLGVTVGALKASYHHAVKKIEKSLSES
ncbi:MAG: RNA polymerase sigma factor [Bacteroidia bacterium]